MTKSGSGFVCTSSGGPWLKEPGRIGSAAIKGAGFDVKNISESELALCMCSGHGENIIEEQIS